MSQARAGRREWTALAVLTLPLLIVSMDVSVLFFAVPQIAESLQPTATQLLWIFDIYGFVLAGLLLTMGNVADRIGRRRLLLIGAAAFGAASTLAAFAPSAEALILARALLGVGGATLMPSTLAIIRSMFHDETQRAKAVGIWSAVLAGGVGLGPILSGFLLERFWWGSVFLINVPFMVLLLVAAPFLVPESKSKSARVDLLSSALSLVAILSGIHAIKTGAAAGPSLEVAVAAIVAIVGTAAFIRRQGRVASPMVDLSLFGARGFRGSIAIQVIAMFGVMGNAILLTQHFQSVLGMSPLEAALWGLAPTLFVGAAAPMSAALATRVGRPVVIAGGFVVAAVGFALMLAAGVESPLWLVLVAATLIATGLVAVATLVTAYALGVAPSERAGSVSALIETAGEFGGALGMAVLGSIAGAIYATQVGELLPKGLPAEAASAARETLGGATVVAGQLPAEVGQAVMAAARTAYVDAMHVADVAAVGVLIAGAVVALLALPRHISRELKEVDAAGALVPMKRVESTGSQ
jgi:MFS transporter, DHA2 family, multidrug resistance protein